MCCVTLLVNRILIANVAFIVYTCNGDIVSVNDDSNGRMVYLDSVCDSFIKCSDNFAFEIISDIADTIADKIERKKESLQENTPEIASNSVN